MATQIRAGCNARVSLETRDRTCDQVLVITCATHDAGVSRLGHSAVPRYSNSALTGSLRVLGKRAAATTRTHTKLPMVRCLYISVVLESARQKVTAKARARTCSVRRAGSGAAQQPGVHALRPVARRAVARLDARFAAARLLHAPLAAVSKRQRRPLHCLHLVFQD